LEKGERDDRIIQNEFDLLIVEVVEERGETTFCDHVALEKRGKGVVTERLWETCPKRLARPRVVAQPKVATDDVFEKSDGLGLDELVDHVAEDGTDGEKAFVSVTDIGEASLVEKDLLHDEDRDRLGKLRAGFHDAEAEGDDLCREEEVYYRVVVVLLDESADDTEGGEAQVLEWTCFGSCIQERVQEEGYMCVQEELSCLRMRCDALEEREGVAYAIGYMCGQVWRGEHWIDGHDLLEEGGHDTESVPQNKGEIIVLLALF